MTGSNRRPPGCKPGALPAELTAPANRTRASIIPEVAAARGVPADRRPEPRRARGESFAAARPRPLPEVPSSSPTSIRNPQKSWRADRNGSKAGTAGSPDACAWGERREWRRARLGCSLLSQPAERRESCALRRVAAGGRAPALRRQGSRSRAREDPHPAGPRPGRRASHARRGRSSCRTPRRSRRPSTAETSRSPEGRIHPHAQGALPGADRLWPFG